MNDSRDKMEPSYKSEPAYRITSTVVPAIMVLLVLLFVWYSRNQVKINEPRTMTIYCFSAMEAVMEQGLLPAFRQQWFKKNQEQLEFITTFAGSGIITRQIMTRFPAEVAVLSSGLDARRLMTAGLITAASWQELQKQKTFCQSPLVLYQHKNNTVLFPQKLGDIDFDKLKVIIPDPLTSGEGEIAALAIYKAKLDQGWGHDQALAFVSHLFKDGSSHPASAQVAWEQFKAGLGDVLLNYESIGGKQPGTEDISMVYPEPSIMAEHVAVALMQNIKEDQEELVSAFLTFLWSDKAQLVLQEYGFRSSLRAEANSLPARIYTLDSLGDPAYLISNVLNPLLGGRE